MRRGRPAGLPAPHGIPRTGGVYKATCNLDIIAAWWAANPNALIGMPMGQRTGVWTLDIDTGEEHADGLAQWTELVAEHEPITTREHRSASGGPHLIFNWHADLPLGNSRGALPDGYGLIVPRSVDGMATGMRAFLRGQVTAKPFDYAAYNRNATDEFYRAIGAA